MLYIFGGWLLSIQAFQMIRKLNYISYKSIKFYIPRQPNKIVCIGQLTNS